MKDITDLVVVQIRLFSVDLIPLAQIMTKSCIDKVRSDLSFQEIEQVPIVGATNQIVFRRGETKGEKGTIIINGITIEPRRIILEITGTSQESNQVYTRLIKTIESTVGVDLATLASPMLTVETTRCAVSLDFPFSSLFSETFVHLLKNRVENLATNEMASALITPASIDIEINYGILDKTLKNNRVGISPKRLTIALRVGTTSEERRYFISSPFNSDTHLSLIKELEASIVKEVEVAKLKEKRE